MTEDPAPSEAAALTRHIETRYHARHREQLPVLAAMAERVERMCTSAMRVCQKVCLPCCAR